MRTRSTLILLGLSLLAGCSKSEQAKPAASNSVATGNPLTAPVDYLEAVSKAKSSADRTLDTAGINKAIQAFYAGEGRFPTTLTELVREGYLPRLPEPPTGQQFVYNPRDGSFKVTPRP